MLEEVAGYSKKRRHDVVSDSDVKEAGWVDELQDSVRFFKRTIMRLN
jgi:hypothetical protein